MKLTFFGKITKLSLTFTKAVYFFIALILVMGTFVFQTTTKSIFPAVMFPYVSVYTQMIGASEQDIEEMITEPIEEAISDTTDLLEMKSTSSQGSSLIVLKFREDASNSDKVQEIQTKVNNIINNLPKQAEKPVVEEYDITRFPIILIDIPNDKPYFKQMEIINQLKLELKSIDGINRVQEVGIKKPRVNIIPDKNALDRYGLNNGDLVEIISSAGLDIPLGNTEINQMNYSFETENQIKSLVELENLIVVHYQSRTIRLKDIAKVEYIDEASDIKSFSVVDGKRTSIVSLQIYKEKTADMIAINRQVKTVVAEFNEANPYQQVAYSMDLSYYISQSITDVTNNALSGLLSVVVVLFIFIDIREAIIASMVIPLTLIGSILLFEPFGLTINIFTIMGLIIALGMLVDNAIVVIEMIDEKQKLGKNIPFVELVLDAANQVGAAIFSSTLTTICAFIPLAFLAGEEGAIIRVIPIAMAIAMAISFIASVTITPVLSYTFLKNKKNNQLIIVKLITLVITVSCAAFAFSNNWQLTTFSYIAAVIVLSISVLKLFKPIKAKEKSSGFRAIIVSVMKSKLFQVTIIVATVIMLIYSIDLLTTGKIPNEAMPEADSQSLTGTVNLVRGSTIQESMIVYEQIERFLNSKDYISQYSVSVSDDNHTYYIELKNKLNRNLHSKEVLTELRQFVNGIPDVKGNFNVDGEEPGDMPVIIRLYGKSHNDLINEGQRVSKILKSIHGVITPKVNYAYGNPNVSLMFDRDKVAEMNLGMSEVVLQLRYLIAGEQIMNMKVNGETVQVYLHYDQPIKNIDDLGHFKVTNKEGVSVPFDQLMMIEEGRSQSELYHFDGRKTISVTSNYDSLTTVEQVIKAFEKKVKMKGGLSEGITYEIDGEYVTMNASYSDLAMKFVIALILVYVVLLIQFNSYSQPFAIILCVPFSIIGVAIGYYITGLTFSTLTFLGIVSLVGIAINDAIVLIDYINTLRKQGIERIEAIIIGCDSRFKPIIATSLTTIAGVLPLALYSEDYSQMAYALIFGLFSSTLLTLFVVPTVLNVLEGFIALFIKKERKADENIG